MVGENMDAFQVDDECKSVWVLLWRDHRFDPEPLYAIVVGLRRLFDGDLVVDKSADPGRFTCVR
jgi:hypothetical protein